MNRSKVLSLTLASLATAWLLLWANAGPNSPLSSAIWLLAGGVVALVAIWFAWSPRGKSLGEHEKSPDHIFPQ